MRCEICGATKQQHSDFRHDQWLQEMSNVGDGRVSPNFWELYEIMQRLGQDWDVDLITVDMLEDWLSSWSPDDPTWDSVRDKLRLEHVIATVRDVQKGMSLWVAKRRRAEAAQLAHAEWLREKHGDAIPCTYVIGVDAYARTAAFDSKSLTLNQRGQERPQTAKPHPLDARWNVGPGYVILGEQITKIVSD